MAALEKRTTTLRAPGERHKFIIAIDFGTTYSGVGWALDNFSGREGDIQTVRKWPGDGNSRNQKAPTAISYRGGQIRWGYQINDREKAIRGVKLLLDKSKVIEYGPFLEYGPFVTSQRLIEAQGTEPVDVVSDYLKRMLSHTKGILHARGIGSLLHTWDVQYILTVPAVWSDKAKDLTIQAARLAGIPESSLHLISEPEAGAVYAIRTIQPNYIGKNDSFIVCDAGGGTVDLITYRVKEVEPLRLAEVTEGAGAMCGSMVLDIHFEKFIIESVGRMTWSKIDEEAKQITLNYWRDKIKTLYEGPETSEDYQDTGGVIPLPGITEIPGTNIKNGMMYIKSAQIQKIFRPALTKIESLVADQEARAIAAGYPAKTIILVGGFGSSKYLFNCLEKRFSGMKVMQPHDAWSAIIKGAVFRGLEGNLVENRKARCHYGVEIRERFDPMRHHKETPYWCQYREEQMVNGQMRWYIGKGQSVSEKQPIKMPFHSVVSLNGSFMLHADLRVSFDETAPSTSAANTAMLCRLDSDMSKVPKELFKRCKNSKGVEFYEISYDLVMTPLSASLLFELEFNSVPYGTVQASYY